MKTLLTLLLLLASPAHAQNTFFAGTPGDMIYRGSAGWQPVPSGSAGQILMSNGAAAAPTWTYGWGTYTTTPIVFPAITTNRVLGNVTGGNAAPTPITASQLLSTIGYDTLRPPATGAMLYMDGTTGTWQATTGTPNSGYVMTMQANGTPAWLIATGGGGGGTPGGSNTQVQFNNSGTFDGNAAFTWSSPLLTLGQTGVVAGQLAFANANSGSITLQPPTGGLSASVLTLPVATDTLVGKATTDTFTNKTLDTAGTGNAFKINGTTITAIGGNTATVGTVAGVLTPGNCVTIDANLNFIDAGGACTTGGGGGTVNAGTAGQLAYYATSTNAVSGNSNITISAGAVTHGIAASVQGSLVLAGSVAGTTTLAAPTTGTGTMTLQAGTDTLVGRATTDTLTNKTVSAGIYSGTSTFSTGATSNALIQNSGGYNYFSMNNSLGNSGIKMFGGGAADPNLYFNAASGGGSVFQVDGSAIAEFAGVGTLILGQNLVGAGTISLAGSTSGNAVFTAQAIAGTPTVTVPTQSGTMAVSASTGLLLNATTGALTGDVATATNIWSATSNKLVDAAGLNTASALTALTDAATIATDMATGVNFSVTLGSGGGATRTLGTPTNTQPGRSGCYFFTQDGSGSRALTYSSVWKFSGGIQPVLTTTAAAVDMLCYIVKDSTHIIGTLTADVK